MKKIDQFGLKKIIHRVGITVVAAVFMAGCVSTPIAPAPTEQMAAAKVAISTATSAGGHEFAPLQLKSAMEKMDGAEQAIAKKDYVRARQLAEQAQVDAQLAEATARSAKAQKVADALQEDSRVLRQELDRKSK